MTSSFVAAGAVEVGPPPTEEGLGTDGPFATASIRIDPPVAGFGGGVIHHPVGAPGQTFGAVVIAPGFLGSSANYAWMGPRLASHGFVVLLMDTSTRLDLPPSRGQQILAALDHLTGPSSVAPLVDPDRLAVAGHSMGGGGALEAAAARPTLRAAMAFQPWHTTKHWSAIDVPTLVIGAEDDAIAPVAAHAIPFYESLTNAPERAYVELANTPHSASTTGHPAQARMMVTWLKRFLDGDARYERFLCPNPGTSSEISDHRDSCPTGEPAAPPAISGVVTSAAGAPAEGVVVLAYAATDTWIGSVWAVTGPDGTYALDGLPPGPHRVRFLPPAGSGLAGEWFHDAPDRASAEDLLVEPGVPISGVDARLATAGSISGVVTNATGAPVDEVTVMAFAPTDTWVGSVWATTGPDGSYVLEGLPAGPHRVRFAPPPASGLVAEWFDDSPHRGTAGALTVVPGVPVTGVDAQLAAAGSITGVVSGQDGQPIEGATVMAYAQTDAWIGSVGATTGPDGAYALDGVPAGPHRVRFAPPPGSGLVAEWFDDAPDRASAHELLVEPGVPITGVDAELGDTPPVATVACAAPQRRAGLTGDAPADAAGLGQLFEQVAIPGVNDTQIADGTGGVATADLDRDGWPDLLAVDEEGALPGAIRFHRNDGCWTFEQEDITILNPEGLPTANHGIPVLADLNDDGLLDMILTGDPASAGASHRTLLFLARGDHRTFEEVGAAMGLDDGSGYSRQAALADVNGDGWLDIGIGADQIGDRRFRPGIPWQRLFVYQPPAAGAGFEHGRFVDLGGTDVIPGFGGEPSDDPEVDRSSPTIMLRDIDGDRDVDVVQSYHIDMVLSRWDTPTANDERRHGVYAWRNLLADTGEFRFEPIPPGEGSLAEVGWSTYDPAQGVYLPEQHAVSHPYLSSADVDNDGDLDVLTVGPTDLYWHVHTDQVTARLWINDGDRGFREATDESGLGVLDWTYDEWFTFFDAPRPPASHLSHTASCYLSSNQVQRCLDQGPRGLQPYYADTVWGDYDNDGWIDLLVVERHEFAWGYGNFRNVLFRNQGDGTFAATNADWSGIDENSIAAEAVDLNRDGLLDLHLIKDITNTAPLANPGSVAASEFTDSTFWNTGSQGAADNHWLGIRLAGLPERQLVGSTILLLDGAGAVLGRRDVFPVTSYKSSVGRDVHLGLGAATTATLRIEVPCRAPVEVPAIRADRYVEVDVTTGSVQTMGPRIRQLPVDHGA